MITTIPSSIKLVISLSLNQFSKSPTPTPRECQKNIFSNGSSLLQLWIFGYNQRRQIILEFCLRGEVWLENLVDTSLISHKSILVTDFFSKAIL